MSMDVELVAPAYTGPEDPEEGKKLLEGLLADSRIAPSDPRYEPMVRGLVAAAEALAAPGREVEVIDRAFVDLLISEIDARMSRQIDEILHHPTFQKLEAAWRGLKFLVDRVDFRENTRV